MTTTKNEEIPPHKEGLLDAYKSEEEIKKTFLDPESLSKSALDRLPQPTGWRLLVLPWAGPQKTKGGIILSDKSHEMIQITTVVGYVLKMGDLCYKDEKRFPSGAWCKERQWVMFGRYAGSRFRIEGGEVRILNDDDIIGTIGDPRDIEHTY
jgi:co-chaperonin GroES (HSP10)